MAKRWRLSDVVRAMLVASNDTWFSSNDVGWLPRRIGKAASVHGVADTLRWFRFTFPRLLGMPTEAWLALTDEQRADLVVAEARRLHVPRRG